MKSKPVGPDEIQRMEEALVVMEAKLQASYSRMGKSILELADSEQRTVDRLVEEIVLMKRRLSQAKSEVQCPECMVHNSGDSHYCRNCGAKLPESPSQS